MRVEMYAVIYIYIYIYIYRAVSSPSDSSKHFTRHPMTPPQLRWEYSSHIAVAALRLFVHISTTVYSQVFIYTGE